MSIRDTNLHSSFFEIGGKYRTSDGKTLTLKHFCLEEPVLSPRVSLVGLEKGRQVRTRAGEVLTFCSVIGASNWPYVFEDDAGKILKFTPNGIHRVDLHRGPNDIVEILPVARTGVCLAHLEIGQKVRTQDGEMLTLTEVDDGSSWPYLFLRENGKTRSYTPEGRYWNERRPDSLDIAEILPREVPVVSLEDVPIGSTFRTRRGTFLRLELNFSEGDPLYGKTSDGLQRYPYRLDGTSRLGRDYDVVEIVSRPEEARVEIGEAVSGGKFRLRNGKVYEYKGERSGGNLRAFHAGDSLYFRPSGICPNRDSGHEVVELISPPKVPRVPIVDAAKYDVLVLRNGKRFVCTGSTGPHTGSKEAKCGTKTLLFALTGACPGLDEDYDVVEVVPAPKVSIRDARVGDTFVLRNGEQFECVDVYSMAVDGFYEARSRRTTGHPILCFGLDGRCPGWGSDYDVVEVVTAPEPSLADKVFDQVSKVEPASIEKVVISSSDYSKHFEEVKARIREVGGTRLYHSSKIDPGRFEICFK